jgi:hypothetical protein
MVGKVLSVSKGKNGMTGSRGSSVKGILFVLFALAVCFGYFYFFTDVLRPKEETPGQPDVYTSEVKKPLPEHLVQSSSTSAEKAISPSPVATSLPETPSSGTTAKVSQAPPGEVPSVQKNVKALPETGKPSTVSPPSAKTATTTSGETVKAGKAPAKQKTVSATPISNSGVGRKDSGKQAHSVTNPPRVQAAVKPGSSRIPTTGGQTKKVVSGQKPATEKIAKTVTKDAPAKKGGIPEPQPGAKNIGGKYTLVVGSYVLKSSLRADKVKVEKSGLKTSVMPGKMKSEPMNRLLVSEVDSYPAAKEELSRIKTASKDAFFLRNNNRYAIYAGSYFSDDRAAQEQERLRKLGFAPILKKSQAPVPTYSLTAGSYPTRDAALKGAERLKKLGFTPYPIELAK